MPDEFPQGAPALGGQGFQQLYRQESIESQDNISNVFRPSQLPGQVNSPLLTEKRKGRVAFADDKNVERHSDQNEDLA